jgi:hypothetical protein
MKYTMYAKNFRSRRKELLRKGRADLAFIDIVVRHCIATNSQTTEQQEVLHGSIETEQIV